MTFRTEAGAAVDNVVIEGASVLIKSPTLETPALGTPSSGTLTNCTGLPTTGLANKAVTYAKIQDVSANRILGTTTVAGVLTEIECTLVGRELLNDATVADQRNTLGLGSLATQSGTFSGTSSGTNTGDNATNSLYSGLVTNATHTGDATGATALTVVGINNTLLSGLATGLLKNTTTTGVPSIAVAGVDYAPFGTIVQPVIVGSGYSIPADARWVVINNGTTSTFVTLPIGQTITIKNTSACSVSLAFGDSVKPLGSNIAGTSILSATAGKFATLVFDGTFWVIMEAN
jgi:hypothetical protein